MPHRIWNFNRCHRTTVKSRILKLPNRVWNNYGVTTQEFLYSFLAYAHNSVDSAIMLHSRWQYTAVMKTTTTLITHKLNFRIIYWLIPKFTLFKPCPCC